MSQNISAEISRDFYSAGANEFLGIPEDIQDEFWLWFTKSASELPAHSERYKEIKYDGYSENRCFGNGQSVFIHTGIPYHEGFVKCGLSFIHHGYNVHENKVHDVTFESNPEPFIELNTVRLEPYYGIQIPTEVIISNIEQIDLKGYNQPLLLDFYLSIRNTYNK